MISIITPDSSHILKSPEAIATYSTSPNTRAALQDAFDAGNWEPYTPPEQPAPTLAEAQAQVQAEICAHADRLRTAIAGNVTAAEAGSWPKKEQEAQWILAASEADLSDAMASPQAVVQSPAPMLLGECYYGQLEPVARAQLVLGRAQAWTGAEGMIAGAKSLHKGAVAALDTVEAVLAYDWSGGWPGVGA